MRAAALPFLACLLMAGCQETAKGPISDTGQDAHGNTAPATAADRVTRSMEAFLDARSFHAEMSLEGRQDTTNALDFVAPDRYRMVMPMGTQVIIGDVLYLQSQGSTRKMQLPAGTVAQWRDPMRLREGQANLVVEAQGSAELDGVQAHKYLVRNGPDGQPVTFTYWIGPDGLPLQLRHHGTSDGAPYTMTVRYSRFNDPAIVIDTPTASG